ncbi:MAG: hypothetical protein J3Q66DRAFT_89634, partial [Benniella sp.]
TLFSPPHLPPDNYLSIPHLLALVHFKNLSLSRSIMVATSPRRSPAKPKGPNLSLSAVVALAILFLNILLPVDARTYTEKLWAGYKLTIDDVLQSSDGTKTLRITDRGHLILQDGNNQIWDGYYRRIVGSRGRYYLAFGGKDVNVYTEHDNVFYSVKSSFDGMDRLELRNNGILYVVSKNGAMEWTSFCNIGEEWYQLPLRTFLKSGQELTNAHGCLVSPDGNAFMEVRSNGNITTYLGRTPQHTFTRPDREGHSLWLSDTGALSINAKPIYLLWDMLKRLSQDSMKAVSEEDHRRLLLRVVGILRANPNFRMAKDLGRLMTAVSNDFFDGQLRQGTKDRMKRVMEGLLNGRDPKKPYTIFNGTGVVDTYTTTVTNDAKISVKNSKGVEMWTTFPKNG